MIYLTPVQLIVDDWRPWYPQPTSKAGSGLAISGVRAQYRRRNRVCTFTVSFVVDAVGSASGEILIPLPVMPAGDATICNGRDFAVGLTLDAVIGPGDKNVYLSKIGGAFPGVAGHKFVISGSYETPQ